VSEDDRSPSHDGFDADETRMLRNFFRDEAHDYIEHITHQLLMTGRAAPSAELLADLMRTTHTLKGSAATVGLDDIARVAHELEDCFAQIEGKQLAWSQALCDQLVEAVDSLRALLDVVHEATSHASLLAQLDVQLAAIRVARTTPDGPRSIRPRPPSPPIPHTIGEDLDGSERIESGAIPMASDDLPTRDRRLFGERRRDDHQVLRVDARRIDQLMNSVGELTFDRTRIERRVAELRRLVRQLSDTRQRLRERVGVERDDHAVLAGIEEELGEQVAQLARHTSALIDDTDALRRTSSALQAGLTQVRMSSASLLFSRLARSVREFARGTSKRIQLVALGEETEFDKSVADHVTEPLLQLLRNAIAHGIEDPERREQLGKPGVGTIRIEARQQGEEIWIEVADDGAGIDPGRIRQRLVASGRWTPEAVAEAPDAAILRAIFEPGVSSREETDALAGRGVGLDAVRESIARLGGDIRVESTRGEGTTFVLRLPVTTAISQALLFKVGGDVYAIPNVHVVETSHIETSSPTMPRQLRHLDGTVPLVVLHRVLGQPEPQDARRVPAVIIQYAGKLLAITCDRVIGPREIVVKSLGPLLSPLPLFAGGTISGSGKVQLILDTATLVALAHPEQRPLVGGPTSATGGAPRVLIADDSRAVREALHRMLAGAGYIADTADDGQRALEMLREMRYAALVTDLEMPRLDGFGLLEALRADARLARLPALVISSRTSRANRERAAELGAVQFIPKPVTRRRLVDALRDLLAER
jgi:chemosensory pili system protein ChpA (sensor histidine kinase/response regulator)